MSCDESTIDLMTKKDYPLSVYEYGDPEKTKSVLVKPKNGDFDNYMVEHGLKSCEISLHSLIADDSERYTLWLGSTENHSNVAIKQFKTWDSNLMKREISIMKSLEHENIITFLFVCAVSNNLYIGMERGTDGDLFTLIACKGRLDKSIVKFYTLQLSNALGYMHKLSIIHRNVSPDNILLTDDFRMVKLGGFSSMCQVPRKGQCISLRGDNIEYCSPEQITQNNVGTACDVWGLGCLISEMLCGSTPFYKQNCVNTVEHILIAKPTTRWEQLLDSHDKTFIEEFLWVDPSQRISLSILKSHRWMASWSDGSNT